MDDLIAAAKERGYAPTRRMVQDWTELGLLDRPERHGLGRGKGVSAAWPEEQLQLFLTLLEKRQDLKRVAVLANIPVWTWLYYGDRFVPLRQVRRALKSWSGWTSKGSLKTSMQVARQLVGDVGHPEASRKDRDRLTGELARMFSSLPTRFDEDALLPLLEPVCHPKRTQLSRTLGGVDAEPAAVLGLIRARVKAHDALRDAAADDALFHWARYANIVSRADYQTRVARIVAPGASTVRASVPTATEMLLRACLDLATLLGIGLTRPDGPDESLDNPAIWQARHLRSTVRAQQLRNELLVTVEVTTDSDETRDD